MTIVPYDVRGVDMSRRPDDAPVWTSDECPPLPTLAPEHERFRLYAPEDLGRFPPTEWLVPPYLAARELTGLYGKGDTYKSFIALGWSAMLAREGQHVVYIAAEGASGLRARVEAWKAHHHVDALPTLRFMLGNVGLHGPDVAIWIEAMHAQLGDDVPSLVVVDTLARNFVGGNENSAQEMGQFVQGAEAIRREFDTAILVIHHTTKAGDTERGGESLRNASFAMLRSEGDKLVCDRMKEAQPPPPAAIRTRSVAVPELGEGVTSLVVELDTTAPVVAGFSSRPAQLADQILALWAGSKLSKRETARRLGKRHDDWSFRKAFREAARRHAAS